MNPSNHNGTITKPVGTSNASFRLPRPLLITERIEECPGVFTLKLTAPDKERLPEFQPGQFNMLYAFGNGEVPISFSGPTQDDASYVHTIKTLGAVTSALSRLHESDTVAFRGPFGRGWPLQQAVSEGRSVIIVAGGLGLAPLRPVIFSLLSQPSLTADVRLYYGAKHPAELLYRQDLRRWSNRFAVQTTVDVSDTSWHGHVGTVNNLLTSATFDASNSMAFICGPEVMMRFVIRELLKKGLPQQAIYLSMERNMKCATGHCGHCQWGPHFICKNGPVFCYQDIADWLYIREL